MPNGLDMPNNLEIIKTAIDDLKKIQKYMATADVNLTDIAKVKDPAASSGASNLKRPRGRGI